MDRCCLENFRLGELGARLSEQLAGLHFVQKVLDVLRKVYFTHFLEERDFCLKKCVCPSE